MRHTATLLLATILAAGCASQEPVAYDRTQSKKSPLGFFTYKDDAGRHYLEYQGTSGNTCEQLEGYLRRRANEICQGAEPEPYEVGCGVWAGEGMTWETGYKVNPLMGAMPVPVTHAVTYPKVSARVVCKASNP